MEIATQKHRSTKINSTKKGCKSNSEFEYDLPASHRLIKGNVIKKSNLNV